MQLPRLQLHDLKPRDDNSEIKLSVLMTINGHRQVQVARSLECLCRQNWKNFEVMIAHTDGLDGMDKVIEIFNPFLKIRAFPLPVDHKRLCPTLGFKTMFPAANGEVISITQAEMMFDPDATRVLYSGHFEELEETRYWSMNSDPWSKKGRPRFVNFKVGFISKAGMKNLDTIDWHSYLNNIKDGEFWHHGETLSNGSNPHMLSYYEFPWWFTASALADDPIWRDMHIFQGHASIDFWMLGYRRIHNYVEVCPLKFMAYHQSHKITAPANSPEMGRLAQTVPEPDPSTWIPMGRDELIRECTLYGLVNFNGDETVERLAYCLGQAKVNAVEMVEVNRAIQKRGRLPFTPPKLPMPYNIDIQLL